MDIKNSNYKNDGGMGDFNLSDKSFSSSEATIEDDYSSYSFLKDGIGSTVSKTKPFLNQKIKCTICNEDLSKVPGDKCPKCGYKQLLFKKQPKLNYNENITADDILEEWKTEMQKIKECPRKHSQTVDRCKCSKNGDKICAHCRIKESCRELIESLSRKFEKNVMEQIRGTTKHKSELMNNLTKSTKSMRNEKNSSLKIIYDRNGNSKIKRRRLKRKPHQKFFIPTNMPRINFTRHKNCIEYEQVPNNMGWFWTPFKEYNKEYKPGFIPQQIKKLILKTRKSVHIQKFPKEKPTINIKRIKGDYIITMRPLKKEKLLQKCSDPYLKTKPVKFLIRKRSTENDFEKKLEEKGFNNCICHQSVLNCNCRSEYEKMCLAEELAKICKNANTSDLYLTNVKNTESDFNFDFTPPIVIVKRKSAKKGHEVAKETQYNPLDFQKSRSDVGPFKVSQQNISKQYGTKQGRLIEKERSMAKREKTDYGARKQARTVTSSGGGGVTKNVREMEKGRVIKKSEFIKDDSRKQRKIGISIGRIVGVATRKEREVDKGRATIKSNLIKNGGRKQGKVGISVGKTVIDPTRKNREVQRGQSVIKSNLIKNGGRKQGKVGISVGKTVIGPKRKNEEVQKRQGMIKWNLIEDGGRKQRKVGTSLGKSSIGPKRKNREVTVADSRKKGRVEASSYESNESGIFNSRIRRGRQQQFVTSSSIRFVGKDARRGQKALARSPASSSVDERINKRDKLGRTMDRKFDRKHSKEEVKRRYKRSDEFHERDYQRERNRYQFPKKEVNQDIKYDEKDEKLKSLEEGWNPSVVIPSKPKLKPIKYKKDVHRNVCHNRTHIDDTDCYRNAQPEYTPYCNNLPKIPYYPCSHMCYPMSPCYNFCCRN